MISYSICKKIRYPRDLVFETMRDNQVEINEKLPNVERAAIIQREILDTNRMLLKSRVKGNAPIPFLLKNAVSPEKITWIGVQTWDKEQFTCSYNVESLYYKDNVDVQGAWEFRETNDGCTEIAINTTICIDASCIAGIPDPFAETASRLVEKILGRLSRPSLTRICTETTKLIKKCNGCSKAAPDEFDEPVEVD